VPRTFSIHTNCRRSSSIAKDIGSIRESIEELIGSTFSFGLVMSQREEIKALLDFLFSKAPFLSPRIIPHGFSNDLEFLVKREDLATIQRKIAEKECNTKTCSVERCKSKIGLKFVLTWKIDLERNGYCLSSGKVRSCLADSIYLCLFFRSIAKTARIFKALSHCWPQPARCNARPITSITLPR
jgi:hypothetical protein